MVVLGFCEFLDVFKFKFINKYINIILVDLLIVYLVVIGFYGFIRLKFRYFYLFLMEIKRWSRKVKDIV